eukprot:gene29029-29426_t
MGIAINGVDITDAQIASELPHHQHAANPLKQAVHEVVLRQLLLQEAARLGVGAGLEGQSLGEDDLIEALFELPFMELVFQAAQVHRRWFDPSELQLSQLLSVKTGGCAENCGYCSQSASFKTGLQASKLMDADTVIAAAKAAQAGGAQRFCMGAAWRDLKDRDLPKVAAMIGGVKALGRETCATLGTLTADRAVALQEA